MPNGLRMNLVKAISPEEYMKAIDALYMKDYRASLLAESFRKISLCLNNKRIEDDPIYQKFLEDHDMKEFPSGNIRINPKIYVEALKMREDVMRSNHLLTQNKIKDIEEEDRSIFDELGVNI